MDVPANSTPAGEQVQIWDCHDGRNQSWTAEADGTLRALGLCLSVAGSSTANGAAVRMTACDAGPAQQFYFNANHDLIARAAGKCVDVIDHGVANSSNLQIWQCTGAANQKWNRY